MPVPQPVLEILNSFSIVTPGPGAQVAAGTPISPALNTDDPQGAFAVLTSPEVLAALDLDLDLDDIALTLSPADGKTNLDVVLKAVQFSGAAETLASNVPVNSQATGKLPYLVPTTAAPLVYTLGGQVEGLLGTAEGTIQLADKIVGKLAGKITGNITRTLLDAAPQVSVSWGVQDAAGRDLTATEVVNLGTAAVPVYVLLPPFVEFTGGPVTTTERRITCTIIVTVGGEQVTRILGPVTVQMPEVQIPTLLVMTEHAVGDSRFPGRILMAVPANSALDGSTDIDSILAPLGTLMTFVAAAVPAGAPVADAFGAAGTAITRLRGLLSRTWFSKADSDGWLRFGFLGIQSFEDMASRLLMIGPPGRRLRLYGGRRDLLTGNFVERFGTVNITLGPTAAVDIPDFTTGMPPIGAPSGLGGLDSAVAAGVTGGLRDFNDVLSAYKFLGPQEL